MRDQYRPKLCSLVQTDNDRCVLELTPRTGGPGRLPEIRVTLPRRPPLSLYGVDPEYITPHSFVIIEIYLMGKYRCCTKFQELFSRLSQDSIVNHPSKESKKYNHVTNGLK